MMIQKTSGARPQKKFTFKKKMVVIKVSVLFAIITSIYKGSY